MKKISFLNAAIVYSFVTTVHAQKENHKGGNDFKVPELREQNHKTVAAGMDTVESLKLLSFMSALRYTLSGENAEFLRENDILDLDRKHFLTVDERVRDAHRGAIGAYGIITKTDLGLLINRRAQTKNQTQVQLLTYEIELINDMSVDKLATQLESLAAIKNPDKITLQKFAITTRHSRALRDLVLNRMADSYKKTPGKQMAVNDNLPPKEKQAVDIQDLSQFLRELRAANKD
jgi:hypothetical protein